MIRTLYDRVRALLSVRRVQERLDDLADDEQAVGPDPILLFAGRTLPDYSDRLPAAYGRLCTEVDTVGSIRIMRYEPRMWEAERVDGQWRFHLTDGHMGGYDDGEVEFTVTIDPDQYVAFRLAHPQFHDPDDAEVPVDSTTSP